MFLAHHISYPQGCFCSPRILCIAISGLFAVVPLPSAAAGGCSWVPRGVQPMQVGAEGLLGSHSCSRVDRSRGDSNLRHFFTLSSI